jgi:hypothetical protein
MNHVYKNQGAADDALLDALLTEPNKPANIKKEQFFFAEITDTFGGDANYSWITRRKIKANTARGAICKLSKDSGLSWRKNYDTGDTVRYDSKSGATCVFISQWDETQHAEYRVNEI